MKKSRRSRHTLLMKCYRTYSTVKASKMASWPSAVIVKCEEEEVRSLGLGFSSFCRVQAHAQQAVGRRSQRERQKDDISGGYNNRVFRLHDVWSGQQKHCRLCFLFAFRFLLFLKYLMHANANGCWWVCF